MWRGRLKMDENKATQNDHICVMGISVTARIGVFDFERRNDQQIKVDVQAFLDLRPAGQKDDLTQTIDYRRIAQVALETGKNKPYDLLEAYCETVATKVLALGADYVIVTAYKPNALENGVAKVTLVRP
jgi:7,8-dihydroneopterin aldolase/epimerase/oxygenase